MINLSQCQKVFEGKGFLSNYKSNPRYFSTIPCGHIKKINPLNLYIRVLKFNYFYDKCLLIKLIDAKIDICEDKDFVFSDWDNEIYTFEELWKIYKNDCNWYYVEYAK